MMLCSFTEANTLPQNIVGQEAHWLAKAATHTTLANGFVITSHMEEMFYLSNNLPEQLRNMFAGINPRRLDEDALAATCQRAQHSISHSFLLDDQIQQIELAVRKLNLKQTHLRRPNAEHPEPATDKRGILLALKRIWSEDWGFESVLKRLDLTNSVGLEARATYVFAGGTGAASKKLSTELSKTLGKKLVAYTNEHGLVGLQ